MLVADAGLLVEVEKEARRARRALAEASRQRLAVLVPAPVLSQVWRGGRGRQVLVTRLLQLEEVTVVPHDEDLALATGVLLGQSGTSDVVDAAVVALARRHDATVATSDPDDLRRLDPALRLVVV